MHVYSDPASERHVNDLAGVESPKRFPAALAGVEAAERSGVPVEWRTCVPAEQEALAAVHDPAYLERVRKMCAAGEGYLSLDTAVGAGSWEAASLASGAAYSAVESAVAGETAFAVARPPGHHAGRDYGMGFCITNHAAVATGHALSKGLERVAILDWDVHHGNGTQDIFYDDPRVLYASTHESPLYPGTGRAAETGGPSAPRCNLNLPFPAGTRGDVYRQAFDEVIAPVVTEFAPDWMFISAGFDGHRNDPLAGLELTSADFADFAVRLQALVPARRTVVVLEGGYDLDALSLSTASTLAALIGERFRPEGASNGDVGAAVVTAARQQWDLD